MIGAPAMVLHLCDWVNAVCTSAKSPFTRDMIQPEVLNLHIFIGFLLIFTGEQGEFLLLYNACTQEMLNANETGCKEFSVLRGSRINSSPCQQWDTCYHQWWKKMWLHSHIISSQMVHIYHEWINYTWRLPKSRIPVIWIWIYLVLVNILIQH